MRFDALNSLEIVSILKSLPTSHETGLFLEITPTLAQAAGVRYRQTASWHSAGSALLTGYSQEERVKQRPRRDDRPLANPPGKPWCRYGTQEPPCRPY